MEKLSNIDTSLSDTLRNSDLQNVTEGLAETFIDSMLNDGILKDLPIVGSIVGLSKTAISIKNMLFIKNLFYFLSGINHISIEERRKMIDSVNESKNQKIKVGEKLIYILDKCDDYIDAKYIAQLFCAFLEKKVSYEEFLKGSRIIQSIFVGDLEYFLATDISEFEKKSSSEESPTEDVFPLINVGICGFGYNPISVDDQDNSDSYDRYKVEGGEAVIWVSSIGRKIKEILKIVKR